MRRKRPIISVCAVVLGVFGLVQAHAVELRDIHFTDLDHGWVVGHGGTLLKTIDGGTEWDEVELDAAYDLNAVHFSDVDTGSVVGNQGTILHTTDGGNTWLQYRSRERNNLNQVHFVGNHGWIVGDEGTILASTDSGKTWSPQKSNTPNNLTGVSCVSTQEGWIVGARGTVLHTTDGGKNWQAQSINTASEGLRTLSQSRRAKGSPVYGLTDVHFADPLQGWATGLFGLLLATTDGGQTWQTQDVGLPLLRWGKRASLKHVHLHGNGHGCIVGEGGTVVHTKNSGKTWYPRNLQISSRLNSVFFLDHQHGWAVGDNFTILRTVDGGNTWQIQM